MELLEAFRHVVQAPLVGLSHLCSILNADGVQY